MRNNKFTIKSKIFLDPNQMKEARAFLNFNYLRTETIPHTVEVPKGLLEAHSNLNKNPLKEIEIELELDKNGKVKIIGIK